MIPFFSPTHPFFLRKKQQPALQAALCRVTYTTSGRGPQPLRVCSSLHLTSKLGTKWSDLVSTKKSAGLSEKPPKYSCGIQFEDITLIFFQTWLVGNLETRLEKMKQNMFLILSSFFMTVRAHICYISFSFKGGLLQTDFLLLKIRYARRSEYY